MGDAKRLPEYTSKIKELLERDSCEILKKSDTEIKSSNDIVSLSVKQKSEKECNNAVVISLRRNHEGRLRIFRSRFNFPNMNLNVIEGIDGLSTPKPQWCDLKPGTYGCLLSHIKAIEFAKAHKLKNVLILEDDVRFIPQFKQNLDAAMSELPDDWDILWLGGADQILPQPYSGKLNKLISAWGGYGYILRDTVYDFFIDCLNQRLYACDDYYRRYQIYFNSFRTKKNYVIHANIASVRIKADEGVAI